MISGVDDPEHDERPWGSYTVLDEGTGYKVKRIVVMPGKRLSYQLHHRRSEHRVGNDSADVPFVFIEVQRGDYLGEDDIVRLQDDYGRAGSA
jgi:mannose-6-phosphate isomerase